jgi:hypothetical protein
MESSAPDISMHRTMKHPVACQRADLTGAGAVDIMEYLTKVECRRFSSAPKLYTKMMMRLASGA